MKELQNNTQNKKTQLRTEVKKKMFLEALKKTLGVKYRAMNEASISDQRVIDRWREQDPKFAEDMDAISNIAGDFVETQLFKKIKEGDTTAIIFYCKTKLKKRGYSERMEVDNINGCVNIMINKMSRNEIEESKRKREEDISNRLGEL